jgi:hypothetical protein
VVMKEKASTEEFHGFLQKVRLLDLSPIAYQLMQSRSGLQWTREQTTTAIAHYLAFLYLIHRYPHLQLSPSWEIDQVWHYHILDTVKYAEDCQTLFGYFIHHFPYLGTRDDADQRDLYKAFALTQVLFHKHFGIELILHQRSLCDCEPLLSSRLDSAVHCHVISDRSTMNHRPGVDISMTEVIRILPLGITN